MSAYQCTECGAPVRLPVSDKIKTVSCRRCGDVSMIHESNVRRMYPALHMHPIDTADGVPSKWMPTHTRPVRAGVYHVRFRHTEPFVLQLYWDGGRWRVPTSREVVDASQLLTWCGVLA